MPYARKSRKSSRYRSRKRVSFAGPKIKKTTKTYVKKNAMSVVRLRRDVNYLKRSQHGSIQQNMQNSQVDMVPIATRPILTDLTDFTCFRESTITPPLPTFQGAQFYQYDSLGNLATTGGYDIQDYEDSPYWSNQNLDRVDTGKYLPVMARYTVRVEGRNSLDNTRVRLQVFQAKAKALVPSNILNQTLILPTGLQHLTNMADPTLNRLNPVFFREYKKLGKTFFINSTKTDASTKGTTGNIMYYTFTIRPKKMKYQSLTAPYTPDDQNPEAVDGNFGPLQISPESPLWLLISTDDATAVNDQVRVRVSRRVVWRDSIGSSRIVP